MSDRSGVEIDYCPKCRGVWLDRGEIDKIIERSITQPAPLQPGNGRRNDDSRDRDRDDDRDRDRKRESERDGYSNGRGRKKENWLGELFG